MIQKVDPIIIKEFKELDTTSVSDALDRFGVSGGLLGIKALIPGISICGQAFTTHNVPCELSKEKAGDYLDEVEPGQVVVIDNAGRDYCTVWGDLMSMIALRNGVAGTIIDGVCRDISNIKKISYPVFAKGNYMVTGKERVYLDAVNIPVSICGVQVQPGDIIMADENGVLVIPFKLSAEVLEAAREIAQKEAIIEQYINKGMSLKEARGMTGYHTLQSRKDKTVLQSDEG
jgi:regulator of RNase E activity RraA